MSPGECVYLPRWLRLIKDKSQAHLETQPGISPLKAILWSFLVRDSTLKKNYFKRKQWRFSLSLNSCMFSEDLAWCHPESWKENFLIIQLWTVSGIIFLSTWRAVFLQYLYAWRWKEHCQCQQKPKVFKKQINDSQIWVVWKYHNVPLFNFMHIFWGLIPSDFSTQSCYGKHCNQLGTSVSQAQGQWK